MCRQTNLHFIEPRVWLNLLEDKWFTSQISIYFSQKNNSSSKVFAYLQADFFADYLCAHFCLTSTKPTWFCFFNLSKHSPWFAVVKTGKKVFCLLTTCQQFLIKQFSMFLGFVLKLSTKTAHFSRSFSSSFFCLCSKQSFS